MPPPGYLQRARELCDAKDVLLCADEIQTGLGRTGRMFCADHEGIKPDLVILGKALSGGFYPVSAVAGKDEVLGLFTPGTHGSTYGGNPLACAIAQAALDVIEKERLPQRAAKLGAFLLDQLRNLRHPLVAEIRGQGLLIGVELKVPARPVCEDLMGRGLLAKDTHDTTIRLAPPLVITQAQLVEAVAILKTSLDAWSQT